MSSPQGTSPPPEGQFPFHRSRRMKHFFTLLSHEIRMLLVSPATYVAATLFLGFMGLVFTKILEAYYKTIRHNWPNYQRLNNHIGLL